MPRRSKTEEMADVMSDVISPLAMDVLAFLQSIGVILNLPDTVAFLTRFERKATELTSASSGQEVKNGQAG